MFSFCELPRTILAPGLCACFIFVQPAHYHCAVGFSFGLCYGTTHVFMELFCNHRANGGFLTKT